MISMFRKTMDENLKDVDKVNADLIQKILKENVKSAKTDPEFEITTDALKNGPPELNEHIAAMIRACLIHGYILVLLLSCSIRTGSWTVWTITEE